MGILTIDKIQEILDKLTTGFNVLKNIGETNEIVLIDDLIHPSRPSRLSPQCSLNHWIQGPSCLGSPGY